MRFDVWLVSFAPGKAPARALAQTYGIDMQEALTLELTLPTIVARDLSEGASARAVLELRAIGGRAEARPADPNAVRGRLRERAIDEGDLLARSDEEKRRVGVQTRARVEP